MTQPPLPNMPAEPPHPRDTLSPPDLARYHVMTYVTQRLEREGLRAPRFKEREVFLVFFTYILGGWKAMIGTTFPDGMYYEVTYDEHNKQTYIDVYRKTENVCIPDDPNQPVAFSRPAYAPDDAPPPPYAE